MVLLSQTRDRISRCRRTSRRRDLAMGLLLIAHDLGIVSDLADRMVVMHTGRKCQEAPVDALFKAPLYPYAQGLIGCSPKLSSNQHIREGVCRRSRGTLRQQRVRPDVGSKQSHPARLKRYRSCMAHKPSPPRTDEKPDPITANPRNVSSSLALAFSKCRHAPQWPFDAPVIAPTMPNSCQTPARKGRNRAPRSLQRRR
jgi:ABC-type glutathione transport system ATPase component